MVGRHDDVDVGHIGSIRPGRWFRERQRNIGYSFSPGWRLADPRLVVPLQWFFFVLLIVVTFSKMRGHLFKQCLLSLDTAVKKSVAHLAL